MKPTNLVLAWLVALWVNPAIVRADFFYSLRFGQTSYAAAPGSRFLVDIFFREEVTGASVHRLGNNPSTSENRGLIQGNVQVFWDTSAYDLRDTTLHPNHVTTNSGTSGTLTSIAIIQQLSPDALGTDVQASPSIREVRLGILDFLIPTAVTTATTLSFVHPNTIAGDDLVINTASGNFVADSLMQLGTATITNPEPSTILLLGTGLIGAAVARRLRQRQRTAAAVS